MVLTLFYFKTRKGNIEPKFKIRYYEEKNDLPESFIKYCI